MLINCTVRERQQLLSVSGVRSSERRATIRVWLRGQVNSITRCVNPAAVHSWSILRPGSYQPLSAQRDSRLSPLTTGQRCLHLKELARDSNLELMSGIRLASFLRLSKVARGMCVAVVRGWGENSCMPHTVMATHGPPAGWFTALARLASPPAVQRRITVAGMFNLCQQR